MPAIHDAERVLGGVSLLVQAARALDVPITVSEQYPVGLGGTVPSIGDLLKAGERAEKLHFSCASDTGLASRLEGFGRGQIVICGVEAHVCVLQSALGLQARGYEVFVVLDACGSRHEQDLQAATARLRHNGIETGTCEMVCFEWLDVAGTDRFREVSRLIKQRTR